MQMHDTLRQVPGGQVQGSRVPGGQVPGGQTGSRVPGGSAVDALAASFNISQGQARAVMRAIAPEFTWALEMRSLSRGGLADLVEAVGHIDQAKYLGGGNVFQDAAARADGHALLGLLLGPADAGAMLAADVARRTRVSQPDVAAMLPGLAVLTVAALAGRARSSLGAVLARMPALGRWSKGSPHADLADILRRRCGAGPHAQTKLRRVVRSCLARAGGFDSLGVSGWYLRFMVLRPVSKLARPLLSRVMPQDV